MISLASLRASPTVCGSPTSLRIPKTITIQTIPVIGIGAGAECDGQVLVINDMLGLNREFHPRFVRQYADLSTIIEDAVGRYLEDVRSGDFPSPEESY